jgi:D-sedoheptulose 7-phosphate isomerase
VADPRSRPTLAEVSLRHSLPSDRDSALRTVAQVFDEHAALVEVSRGVLTEGIVELAGQLAAALLDGRKLIVFGNGGSAADAQHFAAEHIGRFSATRPSLAAIALTTDTSVLTAISNDFGFEHVFARQAEALAQPGDVVVGISTSGNSASVVAGIAAANLRGARTWALSGAGGGQLAQVAERSLVVPSTETARVQELHITAIHAVCRLIDTFVAPPSEPA